MTAVGPARLAVTLALLALAAAPARAGGIDLPTGANLERVDFERHVMGLFGRMGCNAGSCHGSFQGKGGFRLSLLGFDPAFDHSQIVQSAEGRRVVVSDPERSILLQKPTLTMEHGGGERFKVNSREYQILRRWLEDGAPEPAATDPHVTKLVVWPARRIVAGGVQVNGPTYGSEPHMPFGGLRDSGTGWREAGTEAIDVYSDLKTLYVNHDPARV